MALFSASFASLPQHCLYLSPLWQGQGEFRGIFISYCPRFALLPRYLHRKQPKRDVVAKGVCPNEHAGIALCVVEVRGKDVREHRKTEEEARNPLEV